MHRRDGSYCVQVTISTITYDNIGRVVSKGASNSTQTYSYNIRDWVKKIENSLFKEYIGYNETSGDVVPANKFYNGNIGAIAWRAGSENANRTYQFTYNGLDWLTAATYSGTGSYSTSYSYDKMGNLQTLTRYGKYNSSTYQLIDNLSYTYTGNQITKIEDASTYTPTYTGAFNFVNGASQSGEYTYDQNGNLTKDLNKNISSIGYNLLNLPTNISYSSGKSAAYVYDATGRKLRVSYKASASATAVPTDYCGNMIYENNVLKQILIDGGYVTFSGTAPYYHYYLKDHLGSNRVVVSPAGTAEQINHYYPFGGLFGESTSGSTQRFKFNGKEFDRTHGVDWYDYGARHMSPDAGRFTTIDPMAEKYYNTSPYAYCANNPINAIDMKGDTISALGCEAQRIILYSLSTEDAKYVEFYSNGMIDTNLLNKYKGQSNNINALKTLANSDINYFYTISDQTHDGRYFSEESKFRGITEMPGAENGCSPDNSVWIITSSKANTELQVRNFAHEAYGHAYMYEITRDVIAASHTYESGIMQDWFPEYNAFFPVSVRIPSNTRLENQIHRVTEEAVNNYKRYWKK